MLDLKFIKENSEIVKKKLATRGINNIIIDELMDLYGIRSELLQNSQNIKEQRNKYSKHYGKTTTLGISNNEAEESKKILIELEQILKSSIQIIKDSKQIKEAIESKISEVSNLDPLYSNIYLLFAALEEEEKKINKHEDIINSVKPSLKLFNDAIIRIEKEINDRLNEIPNLPADGVPVGKTADENVEVRQWGEKPNGDFKYIDHVELGKKHDILNFETGAKISGSGFPFYKGKGAILERALINFMLDSHRANGYTEVFVPFLVNRASMEAAEKVPKFEDDMYRVDSDDLFAIPTAEVPILNIHRDEIIKYDDLPIKYCGYTACFRREAGSYGKDLRGLLRVHQFNKVELINFCTPDSSYDEMHKMLLNACGILEALNIHYRVLDICTGDMGFAASKQYDIETWSPAENKWLEASSVSNCTDFQSRRAMVRFRKPEQKGTEYAHILNGSGLATSRLMVSLLESYQTPDGKIIVPKALHKYTGFETIG